MKTTARDGNAWIFTALDEEGKMAGHFCMRLADYGKNSVRLGYIIVDPEIKGKGYGRQMLSPGVMLCVSDSGDADGDAGRLFRQRGGQEMLWEPLRIRGARAGRRRTDGNTSRWKRRHSVGSLIRARYARTADAETEEIKELGSL